MKKIKLKWSETLKKFETVLLAEKEALIKNNSAKVIAVIAEKETFMEVLQRLMQMDSIKKSCLELWKK